MRFFDFLSETRHGWRRPGFDTLDRRQPCDCTHLCYDGERWRSLLGRLMSRHQSQPIAAHQSQPLAAHQAPPVAAHQTPPERRRSSSIRGTLLPRDVMEGAT